MVGPWQRVDRGRQDDMTQHPLRLTPGTDLRNALEGIAKTEGARSGSVLAGIGSLINPRLRFANRLDEATLTGAFEILNLSGTLTPDGAHLHMSISDEHGRVFGGHVGYGNEVRTTAEILLMWLSDFHLAREFDPHTGFKELVVHRDK